MNKLTGGQAQVGTLLATGATLGANGLTMVTAAFTVGAEASNVINVSCQLKDGAGVNIAVAKAYEWYLATNSTGLTPATSAPSGGTAAGTAGKIIEQVAELSGIMVFTAAGLCDINITDTGTPTLYLVVILPGGGLAVSGAITFA